MIELKSYTLETHQGPHLNLNEDLIDVDLGLQLFMVIDGFGGSNVGDRAALSAKEHIKYFFGKISVDPESTLPFFFSSKYLLETNALINAFRGAHEKIYKENLARSINNRGGASVIALALTENMATIVATGNCLALLFRKENLITQMLPDAFADAPMSGIGLFEDFHYQATEFKLMAEDTLILLTDGAYQKFGQFAGIQEVLKTNPSDDQAIIKEIFQFVNDRGNLDNQSIVILRFEGQEKP
jgi:serine/threonine protein phosphatase PrpC